MKLRKTLAAVLSVVLLAGTAGITVFAEDNQYDGLPIEANKIAEELEELSEFAEHIENLTDAQKTEYQAIVSAAADKITDYIRNLPTDENARQKMAALNEELKTLAEGIYADAAEKLSEQAQREMKDRIEQTISDIMENIGEKIGESLEENLELSADETEFTWDKNSDSGITIQTNSNSKSFAVKKNGQLCSSSLINSALLINYGTVYLGSDFLKKLDNGENTLELVMKEGSLDIIVNVTDYDTEIPVSDGDITVKETYFEWDKSDLIGIAVSTSSKSKNVAVSKDGEFIASSGDRGIYIVLGRLGITAKVLKKLDIGENKLTLSFDDGTAEITVNVTDKKHSSKEEITAEKTEFTWNRNSSESIVIKTNSKSESVSVRQDGKIFSKSDRENISISGGTVTLKPEFLSKLNDGKNELKLIFDDGNITVNIHIMGSEDVSESSEGSKNTQSSSSIGILPNTGSTGIIVGAVIALISAGLSGILLSTKRKREK